jgi:MarR family transcriptional regulator for hemolysin
MATHDFGILLGLAYQGFVEALHAYLAEHGFNDVGNSHGYVVRLLAASPGITQRELARHLAITEQRAGQIVEDMARGRFVTRKPAPNDARARVLDLGPRGQELLELARKFHATYERRLARKLGASVEATRAVLEHIVASSSDETAQGRLRAT